MRLESLISIRICSRETRQHILLKQCLIGIGSDPFTFSGVRAIGSDGLFSSVLGLSLILLSLSLFYHLKTFYILLNAPKQSVNSEMAKNHVAKHCNLLAFVCHHRHWSFCRRLFAYVYINKDTHLLWKQPFPFSSSRLWQEA
jgi:hypothetical protein